MYLKSLEVQGFKSFANKINFEFHNGITCIVGPNGSGKSNVGDAVRWVLGEQSAKQLRGANMQDVIFSGTENRKSQGFASVSITLDNSDHKLNIEYDEVTVSRRVYRSGESEYRLNGNACRLKDVNELFFDTGIGKEGYSIIGQGQIDKILSSRPDDRRELFDEAAGIVKFKYRKAEALKRLESEQANMVRLQDIMSELEKQIGPLERQSKAAREYLKLREELKTYEVQSFVLDQKKTTAQLNETEEKLGIASSDYEMAKKEGETLRAEYDALQEAGQQLEAEIADIQTKINEASMSQKTLEGRIEVSKEQINTEKMNEEHITSRLEVIHGEQESRTKEEAALEQQRMELNRKSYDAASQRDRSRLELEQMNQKIEASRHSMESDKQKIIDLLNEKSSYLTESQKYQTMLEQNMIRRAELTQKLIQSKGEEDAQIRRMETEQQSWNQQKEALSKTRKLLQEAEEGMGELSGRQQELQREYLNSQRTYQSIAARRDSLQNMAERYDGYGNSIRRVMETKEKNPGIRGVVADLIRVDKRYETAIETALGGAIQNIVTDTEQTAKRLIEYLKRNKFGRATFLPLNGINVRDEFRQKEALKEPGIIGLASSLVETDKEYSGLMVNLLGRILVADQMDHALAVAAKYHRSIRIVTLEGDLLNIGGSMTGGAFKNTSNLLGRSRELEELELQLEQEKQKLHRKEEEQKQTAAAILKMEGQLKQLRAQVQSDALKETEGRMSVEAAKKRREEIIREREDFVLETRLVENQINEIKNSRNGIQSSIQELENQGSQSEESAKAMEQSMAELSVKREELTKAAEQSALICANLEQESRFLEQNIVRIRDEQKKLTDERTQLKERIRYSSEAIERKQMEIRQMQQEILQNRSDAAELEAFLEEKRKIREEETERQKGFFAKRESISDQINGLDREIFRLTGQKEKLEEHLDTMTEYLFEEYELRPSEAQAMAVEGGETLEVLKRLSQNLKNQMKALGNVNVNAIDEYKERMERYVFMKNQYDDLLISEAALQKVVEELDVGMRAQFEAKFAEIKVEFDKVFKELFGGGRGTLELVEDEDIIEAGVRIISQPPGKKLQNMMQLSGGEKALTAISLLFAIQNLKPSPFCLLDEIEAALDDSNVGRFAGYLHKLTEHTQFIIITHRRGTMTAADRLYGITMQEKGVSALVSVNLIEQDLDQ